VVSYAPDLAILGTVIKKNCNPGGVNEMMRLKVFIKVGRATGCFDQEAGWTRLE
jgi:hypothetical protein